CIDQVAAPAVMEVFAQQQALELGHLTRNPQDREEMLSCVALVVKRAGRLTTLPAEDFDLQAGDEVLFCGTQKAEASLRATLKNYYNLEYLRTGVVPARSYAMSMLTSTRGQ
ncbi:MAG: TrkA C-terminal domain-containing protein, partial [Pseudomonadales bacterium]